MQLAKDLEEETSKGIVMTLSKEDYREPKLPSGYVIKSLPASSASILFSKWDYNFSETEEQLSERLAVIGGVGAFRPNLPSAQNNDMKSLVSWTQQYTSGMIGMTYTLPEERRKGLAGAVILALAKQVLDRDGIAFSLVEATNKDSIKLHENLGFKIVGTSGISLYLPLGLPRRDLQFHISNLH